MGSPPRIAGGTTSATALADPLVDEARIRAQLERRFRWLKFEPRLEDAYRDHLHRRLLRRIPLVSITALVFSVVYSVLDYSLFPTFVSAWTIPIRLLVVCPVVVFVMWASRSWPRRAFLILYGISYGVGALSVVAIITVAHSQGVMMPYDGLFLVLMFGYFLMALPFYTAVAVSWLIFGIYVCAELLVSLPLTVLLYNAFFLLTANLIGSVGSYIQEHAYRTNFLNLCLIRASQRKAEEANRAKTKFLATASHDLRQPLHAMNLMLGHLEDRLQGSEEGSVVGKVKQSVELLNQLLRSLLDISKLNVGVVKPNYRHVHLAPLVNGIAEDFAAVAKDVDIRFDCTCPASAWVYSDPVLLERVLRNLLTNAFKHSAGTRVQLVVEPQPQAFVLHVRDDGKGIPAAELDQVFLEFHQGHDERHSQKGGLGLGLAIVKHLALLMDYSFGVESASGQGARFWIQVPKGTALSAAPVGVVHRKDGNALKHRRVLLVENDQTALEAMASLLQSWGCEIAAATDVNQAQLWAQSLQPDLVISDYRLGASEDGLALIIGLRNRIGFELPAILVTANTEMDLVEQAGRQNILVAHKPLVPAQLKMMMRRLLPSDEAQTG